MTTLAEQIAEANARIEARHARGSRIHNGAPAAPVARHNARTAHGAPRLLEGPEK